MEKGEGVEVPLWSHRACETPQKPKDPVTRFKKDACLAKRGGRTDPTKGTPTRTLLVRLFWDPKSGGFWAVATRKHLLIGDRVRWFLQDRRSRDASVPK